MHDEKPAATSDVHQCIWKTCSHLWCASRHLKNLQPPLMCIALTGIKAFDICLFHFIMEMFGHKVTTTFENRVARVILEFNSSRCKIIVLFIKWSNLKSLSRYVKFKQNVLQKVIRPKRWQLTKFVVSIKANFNQIICLRGYVKFISTSISDFKKIQV